MSDEQTTTGLEPLVKAIAREVAKELAPSLKVLAESAAAERGRDRPEGDGESYLSIGETCKRFGISRATFDRMLRDTKSGLTEVIVRLPPVTGRVKVPLQAFEAWLRERRQRRRRGRGGDA